MKKLIVFCVGIFMSVSAHAISAVVDYVIDGDTFVAVVRLQEDIGITVRVRILNIDTPEIHGECASEIEMANQARDILSGLLPAGTVVDLQNIKDDKYLGRIDANVILSDGRDVGDVLVGKKIARPYNGGKRQSWCKK